MKAKESKVNPLFDDSLSRVSGGWDIRLSLLGPTVVKFTSDEADILREKGYQIMGGKEYTRTELNEIFQTDAPGSVMAKELYEIIRRKVGYGGREHRGAGLN